MGKRSNRFNRTRKNVNGYKFILKFSEWLESPAYRDLTPLARALLEEFYIIYRPSRNGRLSLETRYAADRLNVTKNTVKQPFYDLVAHGFLVMTKGSFWQERLAREWRLTTEEYNGREPTDEWRSWEPEKQVNPVPKLKSRSQKARQPAPKTGTPLAEICRQAGILSFPQSVKKDL